MMARFLASSFCAGFGAAIALIIAVHATGGTFGQRCERAFPNSALEVERCVHRLANGLQP